MSFALQTWEGGLDQRGVSRDSAQMEERVGLGNEGGGNFPREDPKNQEFPHPDGGHGLVVPPGEMGGDCGGLGLVWGPFEGPESSPQAKFTTILQPLVTTAVLDPVREPPPPGVFDTKEFCPNFGGDPAHPPVPPRAGEGRLGDRPKGGEPHGPPALVNPPHGSPGPQVRYGTQRNDQLVLVASASVMNFELESSGSERETETHSICSDMDLENPHQ